MFPFFILGTVFSGYFLLSETLLKRKLLQLLICPFSTNKHFLLKTANSLLSHEVFGLLRTWVPMWKNSRKKAMFLSASRLSNYRLHSQSPPHHPKMPLHWPKDIFVACCCLPVDMQLVVFLPWHINLFSQSQVLLFHFAKHSFSSLDHEENYSKFKDVYKMSKSKHLMAFLTSNFVAFTYTPHTYRMKWIDGFAKAFFLLTYLNFIWIMANVQ